VILAAFSGTAVLVAVALAAPESPTQDHIPQPPNSASSPVRGFPIEISPHPVLLKISSQLGSARATITLCNPSTEPVIVERVETSCPCIEVSPVPLEVEPAGKSDLGVTFDPSFDPDFKGDLRVHLSGYDERDRLLFRTYVDVEQGAAGNTGGRDELQRAPNVQRAL